MNQRPLDLQSNALPTELSRHDGILFNFEVRNKIPVNKILIDFGIGKEDCKIIGPCICSECSGISKDGKKVYKITEDLEVLKGHCRNAHEKNLNV